MRCENNITQNPHFPYSKEKEYMNLKRLVSRAINPKTPTCLAVEVCMVTIGM